MVERGRSTKGAQPVDVYVGARIRFRRNLLGISQTEMGERIGVTFQQVQKYEKGVNRIGSSRLLQICEVIQVTPAWLFEGGPVPKLKASAAAREMDAAFADFLADDTAPKLILVWPRLPPRLKRRVTGLLLQFVDQTG
jgi:transcriptional regulator with XRE-family HTH domain